MKKLFVLLSLFLFFCIEAFADESLLKDRINERGYECSLRGYASAVSYGDIEAVSDFLQIGYSPETKVIKVPVVFYAVFNEKPEVLEMLLRAGANPNSTCGKVSLLTASIEVGNKDLIKVLIKNKADINKEVFKLTPLNFSLIKKDKDIAKMLMQAGAKPDKDSIKYAKRLKDEQFTQYTEGIFRENIDRK